MSDKTSFKVKETLKPGIRNWLSPWNLNGDFLGFRDTMKEVKPEIHDTTLPFLSDFTLYLPRPRRREVHEGKRDAIPGKVRTDETKDR